MKGKPERFVPRKQIDSSLICSFHKLNSIAILKASLFCPSGLFFRDLLLRINVFRGEKLLG